MQASTRARFVAAPRGRMLAGRRHWLIAGVVAVLALYGVSGCFTEICQRDEKRCVGGNRLQYCSSEHDAWLEEIRCARAGEDGACVSPAPEIAFCSLTKEPFAPCNGHGRACLNGTLVACRYGYPATFDETCPAGACVEEAGEARCSASSADAGTGDADLPD